MPTTNIAQPVDSPGRRTRVLVWLPHVQLIVDVTGFNGLSWFDRSGNFASDKLHVVERFTRIGPDHMAYEATIEDPTVFTRPWKISLPLYRRVERNAELLDFKCVEFSEELLYGKFKKQTGK